MNIQLENYILLLLLLIVAIVLTYFYVRNQNFASFYAKCIVGFLRFLVLFLVLALFLSPIVKCNKTKSIKPKIVLLCDNSASIKNGLKLPLKTEVLEISKALQNTNMEIDIKVFDKKLENLDSLNQKGRRTDIFSALSNVFLDNLDGNLNRIVLITDGNYNEGNNPAFVQNNNFTPIDIILVGDTAKVSDFKIENLEYNKIMLQDEASTLNVLTSATSMQNAEVILSIEEITSNGFRKIDQVKLAVNSKNFSQSHQFRLNNLSQGKHSFRVTARTNQVEKNLKNNFKEFTVDVLNGEKQIEIISDFPHPDLSALKSWIEKNKSLKVKMTVSDNNLSFSSNSDLVVFYQIPNSRNNGKLLFEKAQSLGKSVLFVLGTSTNYDMFNQLQNKYRVNIKGGILQDYEVKINPNFAKFHLKESFNTFQNYPPLTNYLMSIESIGETNPLFWFRMGRIESEQPLISFSHQDQIAIGVIAAENIWKWRLHNYQLKKNLNETQDLFDKIINYLTVKVDKKQLVTYLSSDYLAEGDKLIISANTYNEVYQPQKASKINCIITGGNLKNQSFEMLPVENTYSLVPYGLKSGNYTYKVIADIAGKQYTDVGQFRIYEDDLEDTYTPSNFDDMHLLAERSAGKLYMWDKRYSIVQAFNTGKVQDKFVQENLSLKANDIFSLLMAILIILSTEWLIRKYLGLN